MPVLTSRFDGGRFGSCRLALAGRAMSLDLPVPLARFTPRSAGTLAQSSDGTGAVTNGDPIGLMRDVARGNHATAAGAARPTWSSATGAAVFDGVDDVLVLAAQIAFVDCIMVLSSATISASVCALLSGQANNGDYQHLVDSSRVSLDGTDGSVGGVARGLNAFNPVTLDALNPNCIGANFTSATPTVLSMRIPAGNVTRNVGYLVSGATSYYGNVSIHDIAFFGSALSDADHAAWVARIAADNGLTV